MPSSSAKQARTMAAAAHDPEFARRMGIPQSVARDYNKADEGSDLLRTAIRGRRATNTKKDQEAERAHQARERAKSEAMTTRRM